MMIMEDSRFFIPSNGIVGLKYNQDIIEIIRQTMAIKILKFSIDVIHSEKTQN